MINCGHTKLSFARISKKGNAVWKCSTKGCEYEQVKIANKSNVPKFKGTKSFAFLYPHEVSKTSSENVKMGTLGKKRLPKVGQTILISKWKGRHQETIQAIITEQKPLSKVDLQVIWSGIISAPEIRPERLLERGTHATKTN